MLCQFLTKKPCLHWLQQRQCKFALKLKAVCTCIVLLFPWFDFHKIKTKIQIYALPHMYE